LDSAAELDPQDPGTLYAGTSAGLFVMHRP
jgi:hypothetical protein